MDIHKSTESKRTTLSKIINDVSKGSPVSYGLYNLCGYLEKEGDISPSIPLGIPCGTNQIALVPLTDLGFMIINSSNRQFIQAYMRDLITTLLLTSSPEEVRLLVTEIDTVDLLWIENTPHLLCPRIVNRDQGRKSLLWLAEEVTRRRSTRSEDATPLVVAIFDSLDHIIRDPAYTDLLTLNYIAECGPSVGIYIIGILNDGYTEVLDKSICNIASVFIADAPKYANGDYLVSSITSRFEHERYGAYNGPWQLMASFNVKEGASYVADLWATPQANWDKSLLDFLNSHEPIKPTYSQITNPLLPLAVFIVIINNIGSISFLQRRLKLGYAPVAELIETMTYLGILGPDNGSKPREVLMSLEEAMTTIQKAISERFE